MSTLSERIIWLMQKYDLSQTDLAKIAKVTQPSVACWINGQTKNLKAAPASEICKQLPVMMDWLVYGKGEPLPVGAKVGATVPNEENENSTIVFVRTYKVDFAAGDGCLNYELDEESEGKSYRLSWIQKHHLNPEKLKVFKVSGDSMEPFLYPGDSITVNTADVEIINGKVYAFTYAGGFRVKRLRKLLNGGIQVISDNPSWDTETIEVQDVEHMHIVGRVVDRSGTGGL